MPITYHVIITRPFIRMISVISDSSCFPSSLESVARINVPRISDCQLTLEIRVGLTASMTGHLKGATETTDIVNTLRR